MIENIKLKSKQIEQNNTTNIKKVMSVPKLKNYN